MPQEVPRSRRATSRSTQFHDENCSSRCLSANYVDYLKQSQHSIEQSEIPSEGVFESEMSS
jgi:hypothetical protein